MAKAKQTRVWQNRIVGYGEEAPGEFIANAKNWRVHPKYQQDALEAVLNQVGYVQSVIVNKRTGYLIDGHLRVMLAERNNETTVPVVYVDLSEEEESIILATIDPLSAMAATDSAKLAELLESVQIDDAALEAVLRNIGEGVSIPQGDFPAYDESIGDDVKMCRCPECGHEFPA
jgi:hypothetical protein